ncbi:interleukin-12 subunit beta-like [Myxocyprinus asiaticus]|uniref:interleukin-12 subunit beta-like n=1 Tax=Myxocyprinus asiaticus TaxID=70543 RepID=UPI002223B5C6|nr:interleukin-12 subunit beta-like [Myxocyprinus asiaticus]
MFFLLFESLLFLQFFAVGAIKIPESYWTLKPNVLVVDVDTDKDVNMVEVPLICGEAYEGENVTWTKNQGEGLEAKGNKITVTIEGWKGGNYSCFNTEGSYLNHSLVLAQWTFRKIIKNTPDKGYIHCSTNNYGGSFQCSWTWGANRDGRVAVVAHIKATRSHSESNINCHLDSSGQSITCLDQDYCPYAEEVERINLTIYFRSNFVVETYSTKFYIMDIVKPDMVVINGINQTSVELGYPQSWSTPASYFPLTFQVKEIRCRKRNKCDCSNPNSQEEIVKSHQLPVTKGMTVCVRARDEFCNSSWSEWSQHKCNTRKNRRQRNRKNKLNKIF